VVLNNFITGKIALSSISESSRKIFPGTKKYKTKKVKHCLLLRNFSLIDAVLSLLFLGSKTEQTFMGKFITCRENCTLKFLLETQISRNRENEIGFTSEIYHGIHKSGNEFS